MGTINQNTDSLLIVKGKNERFLESTFQTFGRRDIWAPALVQAKSLA